MNKKLIIVTICFLLIVGALVAFGYVYNADLKQKNLVLQNKVGDMQKEIDNQKSSLASLSSSQAGTNKDVVASAKNIFIDREHGIEIDLPDFYEYKQITDEPHKFDMNGPIDYVKKSVIAFKNKNLKVCMEVGYEGDASSTSDCTIDKEYNFVLEFTDPRDFSRLNDDINRNEWLIRDVDGINSLKVVQWDTNGGVQTSHENFEVIGEKYNYLFKFNFPYHDEEVDSLKKDIISNIKLLK